MDDGMMVRQRFGPLSTFALKLRSSCTCEDVAISPTVLIRYSRTAYISCLKLDARNHEDVAPAKKLPILDSRNSSFRLIGNIIHD
jgi:hypothetical protein